MSETKKSIDSKTIFIFALSIVLLVLIGFSSWSFYNYRQAKNEVLRLSTLDGQKDLQQKEIDQLLSAVAKHLILPQDEQPTVATVSDIEALAESQPFFEGANNGDKVIVYVNASKAIIYSPEKDIIVNVGAVAVDNNQVDVTDIDENTEETEIDNEDEI